MSNRTDEHLKLENGLKIILATGLGGMGRKYSDYLTTFGEENVSIIYWDKTCTDIDSHLQKLKKHIPNEEPFIAIGHSIGGGLWLELLNREKYANIKGLVLVGCARKIKGSQGLGVVMKLPSILIWILVVLLTILAPIMLFVWGKKTIETYKELWGLLLKEGIRKIKKQYNSTVTKLGLIETVKDPKIPLVIVRLKKDTLVDEKDLEYTKSMFDYVHEQIIETDSLHLTEKLDHLTVKKIALEAEFLGISKNTN